MSLQRYRITNLTYFGIALLLSVIVVLFPPHNVFSYDVFGYYMYLPLGFKYHDLTIQDYSLITGILNKYHASETFYQALKWDNGTWVMRYPVGMSVLYSPFYFIADLIAPHTHYPADGFSRPYQLSILYGCLLYTLTGLYFIKRTLTIFFNDVISALTLAGIALGTNYFFHVSVHGQGAMSHNILFSLYAIIVYLTIEWHRAFKARTIVCLALAIGFAALCRASEIISVLIPLLYGVTNYPALKEKLALLSRQRGQVIIFCLVLFSIGMIQFSYYKYASGKFIINPYAAGNPGEGFEFFHPHILEVLFSFRKGWFVYTPLMIFVSIGFWRLYKENKIMFTPVFIYTVLSFYIVASWSCWWYASSFGNRALVPHYAALSIPLGYFFSHILKRNIKYLCLPLLALFIGLNLFQSWQMSVGILDSANMSRTYYFSTFLQTTPPAAEQRKLLLRGKFNSDAEIFTREDSLTHQLSYSLSENFEKTNGELKKERLCDTVKHSGNYSLLTLAGDEPYCLEIPHETLTKKSYTWVKASIWVYSSYPADSLDAFFKIQMKHKGWIFKPSEHKLNAGNFKAKHWNKLEYYFLTPDDLRSTKDLVSICFVNRSPYFIFIDDMKIESYEPIEDKSVF